MCRCAVASPNRASAQGEKKTRAVRRAGSPWQAWAGCRARLRTRCRWVDLGVARSLRRSRSSRHCAHISSLAAAVDVDDATETLATGDGAMSSRHAVAAGELAGHIQAASRATRRRQALIQRHERSVLSSQHVYGGRRCGLFSARETALRRARSLLGGGRYRAGARSCDWRATWAQVDLFFFHIVLHMRTLELLRPSTRAHASRVLFLSGQAAQALPFSRGARVRV